MELVPQRKWTGLDQARDGRRCMSRLVRIPLQSSSRQPRDPNEQIKGIAKVLGERKSR